MEDVKIIKLNGGGTLIYEYSNRNKATSVLVGFSAGSGSDTQNGIAHFSEHMLFKGTNKRSKEQLEKDLREYCGNNFNAYTGNDFTVFAFNRVNVLLDNAFEIASDLLLNSNVTKKNVDNERGVILEEYNSYDDMNKYSIEEEHLNKIYDRKVSARKAIGDKEDLEKITPKCVIEFRKKFYTKENFVISVVGSESLGKIKKLIKKYFLSKFEVENGELKANHNFTILDESAYSLEKKETDNVLVSISLKCVGYNDEIRSPALNIIKSYLTGGVDGLLFKAVRDKGLAYSISTSVDKHLESGVFNIDFESSKDNVNKVIDEIGKVVNEIRKTGISSEEIEKTKMNFEYSINETDKPNLSQALSNLDKFISNKPFITADYVKKFMSVQKEVVDEYFADLFDVNNTIFVTIGGKVKQNDVYKLEEIKSKLLK